MQNLANNYFTFLHKLTVPKPSNFVQEKITSTKSENLLQKVQCSTNSTCEGQKQTKGRHGYHQELENIVNEQIYHEFNAALSYLAISSHFGRTDIALPGCHGYFFNMHLEEHEHALVFVNYQLMRGGTVKLKGIETPKVSPQTPLEAFNTALDMEIFVKEKLIEVFNVAEKHKDLQVQDLITTDFMEEQNKSICELGRLVERAKICNTALGEYLFDKMIYSAFVKKNPSKLLHKRSLQESETDVVYK